MYKLPKNRHELGKIVSPCDRYKQPDKIVTSCQLVTILFGPTWTQINTRGHKLTHDNRWKQTDTDGQTTTHLDKYEDTGHEMISYHSLIAHSGSLKSKILKTWDLVRKCLILSTWKKDFIEKLLKCHLDVWNCYESSLTIANTDNCIFLVFLCSRKLRNNINIQCLILSTFEIVVKIWSFKTVIQVHGKHSMPKYAKWGLLR